MHSWRKVVSIERRYNCNWHWTWTPDLGWTMLKIVFLHLVDPAILVNVRKTSAESPEKVHKAHYLGDHWTWKVRADDALAFHNMANKTKHELETVSLWWVIGLLFGIRFILEVIWPAMLRINAAWGSEKIYYHHKPGEDGVEDRVKDGVEIVEHARHHEQNVLESLKPRGPAKLKSGLIGIYLSNTSEKCTFRLWETQFS